MSLLDKLLSRSQPNDDNEIVSVNEKRNMTRLRNLKVGDEVMITQRVRVVDKRETLDKRLGNIGTENVVYIEVRGIGGVYNNSIAVASGSGSSKIQLCTDQAYVSSEVEITLPSGERDEDEMHGSYSTLPFNTR